MDIVIPYKQSFTNELTYCLRSLRNFEHENVYVYGDRPKLNINYVHFQQTRDLAGNTLEILNQAVANPAISQRFVWMHDDMYILNPIKSIPTHHRGSYTDIIEMYDRRLMRNYYIERMIRTKQRLIELGIKDPLCYELHIPVIIDKRKWRNAAPYMTNQLNKMSMYANINKLGGTKIEDVKVREKDLIPTGSFASSHDSSFNSNYLGQYIKQVFKERSEYEVIR